ncbi:MAG: sucrase ferredoxin [Spirochaetota bacterium]
MQIEKNPNLQALGDCRYCSLISESVGEDLLGTANTVDHWLLIELPLPWQASVFQENPIIGPIYSLYKRLTFYKGIRLRLLLLAPDKNYSQKNKTRIMYYSRPGTDFVAYEKHEFIVPETKALDLALAILNQLGSKKGAMDRFQIYRQETQHISEIIICTNGRIDSACSKFGFPLYRKLRKNFSSIDGSATKDKIQYRVWQCSHFGGHRFAPTLIDLPHGRYWGRMNSKVFQQIISSSGDLSALENNYRGWSGFDKFVQIAEHQLLQRYGWEWFSYPRSGKIIRKGSFSLTERMALILIRLIPIYAIQYLLHMWIRDPKWAKVEIRYQLPNSDRSSTFTAIVKETSCVLTAKNSPKPKKATKFITQAQYSVEVLKP